MDLTGATGTVWGREPVAVLAVVNAVIVLVVAFGVDVTLEQAGAILLITNAVLGFITRASVIAPGADRD